MFYKITLAAVAALLLPLVTQAQESYTIKIKKESKGTSTHEDRNRTETESTKVSDNKGNLLQSASKTTILTEIFDETILEKPDPKRKATLLKRTYQKATAKVDNDAKVMPYQSKTVLIEKKDDKFVFRYEGGGDLTGDDAKWLDKEFNQGKKDSDFDFDASLLPVKAVSVGESWKIDMAVIVKEFSNDTKVDADASKATGTGKLLKAYKKDGRQYGDVQFRLEIPVKAINNQGNIIPLQAGVIVMELSASGCIDGSEMGGRATSNITFNFTAQAGDAMVAGAMTSNAEKTVAEKGKKK